MKYCFIQDDSGHWYIVPAERGAEANSIMESISDYWRGADYDKECPEKPDWIKESDGPHFITFENPQA